jgi:hypothetical protein
MSHNPTHAPQTQHGYSITSSAMASSVGGTVKPSAFRGLEIDDELELGRLHHWQTGRLLSFENSADTGASLVK